jgi:5-formyltetrahydrofolate cyclo-ligase
LRRDMRRKRRALPPSVRKDAAQRIARHLARQSFVKPGARIAVYLAIQGEVDLAWFVALARRRRCRLYLPRLANGCRAHMEFVAFDHDTPMRRNRFGIAEPGNDTAILPARCLDVVLAPLVAFDAQGNRLGMGAGYYDRRFHFLRDRQAWRRPRLIGVAYDLQRVARLAAQVWDVPMDACVTESGLHPAHK